MSSKYEKLITDGDKRYKVTGMYKEWFLDYASYVILERAVPHIDDGLKPVQRRILYSMRRMDDGRYNKVANIIGHTMQFHPHGDASIGDALVQLGQKELLIDCQGNWGNILTGDSAAAPRYIEARLTKFATEVLFNPKTTSWMNSYDGRNKEPINLPVKFPLLLTMGVEGIAVGLASKILPHNFNELIDASIAYLRGRKFELYPDFPTGGLADASRYNQGLRGGAVKVRAKIEKVDRRSVVITELPYGVTTSKLIESILRATEQGKIKVRRVDDNSALNAEIVIHLQSDASPDKTIDALYAFTDCEISISPNACIIMDNHPHFIGVDQILRYNTDRTKELLRLELEIKRQELLEQWHYTSLEKIFFEERVYRILESKATNWKAMLSKVEEEMRKYQHLLQREITSEDIAKLVEKPVRKISIFDVKELNDGLKKIEKELEETEKELDNLTNYAVKYFRSLKQRYGKEHPRKTELTSFETIDATRVVADNAKLYVNKKEGFAGMDLRRDEDAQFVCDCSNIDEVIAFRKDGKYSITKISEKHFFGRDIIHIDIFNRNDERTVYNVVYRHGKGGPYYVKRFNLTAFTRDRDYDITQGKEGSRVEWFTANPNGEAELIKVFIKPRAKIKRLTFEYDFADLAIRGRDTKGNILTRHPLHKVELKAEGVSQFEGIPLWFDYDIARLNEDSRGSYLGKFSQGDKIVVILKSGHFYTTNFDQSNRYQGEIERVEKLNSEKIYTTLYFDGLSGYNYVKRFNFEESDNSPQLFITEHNNSKLIEITDQKDPLFLVTFTGKHAHRPEEEVDAEEFIGAKSFRAKGKRISTYEIESLSFLESQEEETPSQSREESLQESEGKSQPKSEEEPKSTLF